MLCSSSGGVPDPEVWHGIAHALAKKGHRHASIATQRTNAHLLASSGYLLGGELHPAFTLVKVLAEAVPLMSHKDMVLQNCIHLHAPCKVDWLDLI